MLEEVTANDLQRLWPCLTSQEQDRLRRNLRAEIAQQALTFLEWTLLRRWIRDKDSDNPEPILFSLERYPWLIDLYNVLSDLGTGGRLIVKKAAQVGATEMAINYALYTLDGQGSVFYALPPGPTQRDFAHGRVDPAISASPYILGMVHNIDNVGLKTFADGLNFYIRGTAITKGDPRRAAQLSEAPADVLIVDEFDRVPPAAIPHLRSRLEDSNLRVEIDLSTPTYPDVGVDAEYIESTKHEPQIQCQACARWQWLDWSVVRGPVADDLHARVVCSGCQSVIERSGMWGDGRARWVPRNPGAVVVGYWIPRLVSERADLDVIWGRSQSIRDLDRQAFWNNDLGLPYEPKGARLTRELIAACALHPAVYPTFPDRASWCAMGVDVGLDLYYWIKQRDPSGRERSVAIGSCPDWHDLDVLMRRYGVQSCVVDDAPELRLDVAFQKRHRGKVWLAQYVSSVDAPLARWVLPSKQGGTAVVKIERTKGLDEASAKVMLRIDALPADWESIEHLLDHLTVNLKAKRILEDGATVYTFPKTGKPDHLHHAKVYADVAMTRLPKQPRLEDDAEGLPATGGERYMGMRGQL